VSTVRVKLPYNLQLSILLALPKILPPAIPGSAHFKHAQLTVTVFTRVTSTYRSCICPAA